MKAWFPPTWTSLCGGNVMEVLLPQLWQVCVGTLLSGTPFRIPRCTICWSTSPTVCVFVFSTGFFKNHQLSKSCHLVDYVQRVNNWSRDTSQGRWEGPVAVIWLPAFVARLVHQVRLIPSTPLWGSARSPSPYKIYWKCYRGSLPLVHSVSSTHRFEIIYHRYYKLCYNNM